MIEKRSYCRLCHGMCGMVVTVDETGTLTQVRGDKDNVLTRGYACIKGLQAPELHNGPGRLRAHHVQTGPRTHQPVDFETAIDGIAAKLRTIIDLHGPASVAIFTGTQPAYNALYRLMAIEFLKALVPRRASVR